MRGAGSNDQLCPKWVQSIKCRVGVGKLAVRVNNGESFLLILLSQWLETKGNWDVSSKVGVKEGNAALAYSFLCGNIVELMLTHKD